VMRVLTVLRLGMWAAMHVLCVTACDTLPGLLHLFLFSAARRSRVQGQLQQSRHHAPGGGRAVILLLPEQRPYSTPHGWQ
jgi:hypothetical protein